jgi:hypothetical protein
MVYRLHREIATSLNSGTSVSSLSWLAIRHDLEEEAMYNLLQDLRRNRLVRARAMQLWELSREGKAWLAEMSDLQRAVGRYGPVKTSELQARLSESGFSQHRLVGLLLQLEALGDVTLDRNNCWCLSATVATQQ